MCYYCRYMLTDQEAYHALSVYTLAHTSPEFIHQYVVDAYAAQHADTSTKLIALDFAIAGLYLHNVCGYTGKEVQRAHTVLAQHKEWLPHFAPTKESGDMTIHDVLAAAPGDVRDAAIQVWSASVWRSYAHLHDAVKQWVDACL